MSSDELSKHLSSIYHGFLKYMNSNALRNKQLLELFIRIPKVLDNSLKPEEELVKDYRRMMVTIENWAACLDPDNSAEKVLRDIILNKSQ